MKETITCTACGNTVERFKNPLPTADVIVSIGGKVVLIRRRNPPYGWAIPGGFIDWGESAEDAAAREMHEEIGLELTGLRQFHTYSDPSRDPRGHTITVVFTAEAVATPRAGDDAADAGLFDPADPPKPMAFDHASILEDYRKYLETGILPE